MIRRFFLLSLLFLFSIQSANGIIMNNQGLDTGKGFITWEQLIGMPKQMDALDHKVATLQKACIFGAIIIAGLLVYIKLSSQEQSADKSDTAQMQSDN